MCRSCEIWRLECAGHHNRGGSHPEHLLSIFLIMLHSASLENDFKRTSVSSLICFSSYSLFFRAVPIVWLCIFKSTFEPSWKDTGLWISIPPWPYLKGQQKCKNPCWSFLNSKQSLQNKKKGSSEHYCIKCYSRLLVRLFPPVDWSRNFKCQILDFLFPPDTGMVSNIYWCFINICNSPRAN